MDYFVVQFGNENSINAVPVSWITKIGNDTACYWPPANIQNQAGKLIRNRAVPQEDWDIHQNVKIVSDLIDYASAKLIEKKKTEESTTNLDSDTDLFEKKKKNVSRKRKSVHPCYENDSDSSPAEDSRKIIYKTPSKFVSSPMQTTGSALGTVDAGTTSSHRRKTPDKSSQRRNTLDYEVIITSPRPNIKNLSQSKLTSHCSKLILEKSDSKKSKICSENVSEAVESSYTVDAQSVDAQSVDAQSVDAQSVDAQYVDSQSVDSQYVDSQYVDSQSVDSEMVKESSQFITSTPKMFNKLSSKLKQLDPLPIKDNENQIDINDLWNNQRKILENITALSGNLNVILNVVEKVLNISLSVKKSSDIIEAKYQTISNQLSISTGIDESLEETLKEIPSLPLDEMDDFISLNAILANDKSYKAFVYTLHHCGGTTAEEFAKTVLEKVLTNKLASSFNMDGKSSNFGSRDAEPKKAFSPTLVCKAILDAMQLNKRTKGEDPKLAKTKMQKWLAQAAFRKGGGGRK